MKINPKAPYFRVVTSDTTGEDEIFLYGFIGNQKLWDDDPTEELTDLAVVQAIRAADAKNKPFHIRINSPGGYILHGEAIVSAINGARNTIHTHADGIVASMAWDIWLCGHVRHFPENAKGMVHCSGTYGWGNAQDMREAAEMLDKFDEASIIRMARITGMSEDEVKNRFYDYKDHWLTARELVELGIIEAIETGPARHVIAAPERLTYRQLLQQAYNIEGAEPTPPADQPTDQPTEIEPQRDWREEHMQRLSIIHQKNV